MQSKTALVAMAILLIAMPAWADDFFEDAYLAELRVIKADEQAGWALIQDSTGNQRDVYTGDTIGWEQAVVVVIENASIIVEQADLRTRMPVVDPFAGD